MDEKTNQEKIYTTIRLTNSISVPHSGKIFEFSFTKRQYYLYLLSTIAWVRFLKTILIVTGIVGLFLFKPLFIGCGLACLALDVYAFFLKKINWYFVFAYPIGYLAVMSWYGIIYASFLIGLFNLILQRSFLKMPSDVRIDKIKAQNKKVIRMKAYIDIDGVLVTHSQKTPYSDEFIKFLVENFDCYWLTTNVKGNTDFVLNRLKNIFSPETMEHIKKIKPTNWKTLKTEAINLDEDFYWFDDFILQKEREILKDKNKEYRLILIKLKEPHSSLKDHLDFYSDEGRFASLNGTVIRLPK